jgi:serine/threonine protein kinase
MRYWTGSTRRTVDIEPSRGRIGGGGEGTVYRVVDQPSLVAKVYNHHPGPSDKLRAMVRSPPQDPTRDRGHVSIAWPTDVLLDQRGVVSGFLMPAVHNPVPVASVYHPSDRLRTNPGFDYSYLYRAADNLCSAMAAVHAKGYVVGDVNDLNVLVTNQALVTLIDTDSFQVQDPRSGRVYRCTVGREEFTPPELQGRRFSDLDRSVHHDLFGLAVLLFQMLMEGTHPFNSAYHGNGDAPALGESIRQGLFSFGRAPGLFSVPPNAPPYELLPTAVRDLFTRTFDMAHRQPALRPTADVWSRALKNAETQLIACRTNAQHKFGSHMGSCPWCARAQRLHVDFFPSASTPRVAAPTPLPPRVSTIRPPPVARIRPRSGWGLRVRSALALRGIGKAWIGVGFGTAVACWLPLQDLWKVAVALACLASSIHVVGRARGALGLWRLTGLAALLFGGLGVLATSEWTSAESSVAPSVLPTATQLRPLPSPRIQAAALTLDNYYRGLNDGNSFGAVGYFAPSVERYIQMRTTTPAAIDKYVRRDLPRQFPGYRFAFDRDSIEERNPFVFLYKEHGPYHGVVNPPKTTTTVVVCVEMDVSFRIVFLRQFFSTNDLSRVRSCPRGAVSTLP